jgi:hypothetical protein
MSDIISFTLQLKDMMSNGLRNLESVAHSSFSHIDSVVQGTVRGLDKLEEERRLRVDSSGLQEAHGRVKELTTAWEVMRGTMAGEVAFRGLERGFDMARDFLTESIKGGLEEQKTQKMMEVMAGAEGNELFETIHKKYLPTSIYGGEQYGHARDLLSSGEEVGNIMKDLREIGDIAYGDKANFQSIKLALQETIEGKSFNMLQGRILRGTGFNAQQTLAEHDPLHRGAEYWLDQLGQTGKGLELFRKALDEATGEGGRFHDAQKLLAQTDAGKLQIAQTNWGLMMDEFGRELLPALTEVLNSLKPTLEKLPERLHELVPHLLELAHDVAGLITWVVENTDSIKTLIKVTKDLIEVYLAMKAWELGKNTIGAFKAGLTGVEMAGGMSLAGYAGAGAGGLEAAVGVSLGAVGGVTALAAAAAFAAWQLWDIADNQNKLAPDIQGNRAQNRTSGPSMGYGVGVVPTTTGWGDGGLTAGDDAAWWLHPKEKSVEAKGATAGMIADTTDAITGGGRKQIIIKIHQFTDKFTIEAGNVKDGLAMSKEQYVQWFLEVVQSANEAL